MIVIIRTKRLGAGYPAGTIWTFTGDTRESIAVDVSGFMLGKESENYLIIEHGDVITLPTDGNIKNVYDAVMAFS